MAWNLVRSAQYGSDATGASTITNTAFSVAATNGNLIVGFATWDNTNSKIMSSITDDGTGTINSWSAPFELTQSTDGQRCIGFWTVNQRTSGTLTQVTINLTGNEAWRSIIVREYSGNAVSPFDKSNNSGATGSHITGTDTVISGFTGTLDGSADLIVGGTYIGATGGTISLGTNFNNLISETAGAKIYMEDRAVSDTTSVQATFTDSASAATHLCGVMAFKPAAGGGGTPSVNLIYRARQTA
jgi:hypothetical protein